MKHVWVSSGLTHKHWLERLTKDKHSSLLQLLINYGSKQFYNFGPGPESLARTIDKRISLSVPVTVDEDRDVMNLWDLGTML